jgi:hypothetical protein
VASTWDAAHCNPKSVLPGLSQKEGLQELVFRKFGATLNGQSDPGLAKGALSSGSTPSLFGSNVDNPDDL